MLKILAYTLSPWEHAIVNYRLVGPCAHAGWELIRGNLYEEVSLAQIPNADVVVIQRDFPRLVGPFCEILAKADAVGVPVVLELDDLLFEMPAEHPDRKSHYYTEALFPLLFATQIVDAVLTTTKPMRAYLERVNPRTYLLPNYLDDRIWDMSNPPRGQEPSPVMIGYMGGDSHLPDLAPLEPVIRDILERYGDGVGFHFMGCQPPGGLEAHPGVRWTPLSEPNYRAFIQFFLAQHLDIAIAPLRDNLFNRCKSPAKLFEYSLRGIPGVYGRIGSYEEKIQHGQTGFLAGSLADWGQYLSQLIEDPSLRMEMGAKARAGVVRKELLSQHVHEWVDTFSAILSEGKRLNDRQIPLDLLRSIGAQTWDWGQYQ